MSLQKLLADKLATRNYHEIAKQINYQSVEKLKQKIEKIISSPCLALDVSNYDFHGTTTRGFIECRFHRN